MIIFTVEPRYNREPRDWKKLVRYTVQPRYNEALYNNSLGITNDFVFNPSNSKLYTMKRKPDITKPRYGEQICPSLGPSLYRGSFPHILLPSNLH